MKLHTKQDYQELLLKLLNPLRHRYSAGGARLELSGAGAVYSQQVMELEAFARPLWGLVPFWAGGGCDREFEELYRRGLASGSNPGHPDYWGDCEDYDQRFVEMAPIALGLLLVPQILWEPLSGEAKVHLAAWLHQINCHELPKCNWYFFRILVNLALKVQGGPYNENLLVTDLDFIETCYLGDGWYVDGTSEQKDYYCAFAMQFYSLLYAVLSEETDQEKGERFKLRAVEFAEDFIYWFDKNGAGLPFGRSLTYRFAQTAFWSAALFADVQTLEPGVVKGLINRNLEYWFSGQIFLGDGTLSVGYRYPNLGMAEIYNAPGSPYWCAKTFLLLALSDDHPFWEAGEQPLPELKSVYRIHRADMLIQHRGWDVAAYVPGIYNKNVLGHFSEKYAKFVYSTAFGFSVAHSGNLLAEAAPDSMLAFILDGEEAVYVRKRGGNYRIQDEGVVTEWSPVFGIRVRTTIYLTEYGHARRHEITSERYGMAYDCGFAVDQYESGFAVCLGKDFAEVKNRLQGCRVIGKSGDLEYCVIDANPNTSLLFKKTKIPAVSVRILPGQTVVETRIETWNDDRRWECEKRDIS